VSSALRQVAVVGAGAVGCYFGGMLARGGHRVTLIGRVGHVDEIRRRGLWLERGGQVETIAIDASVDLASARGASLVLFCVKSPDTQAVARALAPHLASDACVLSLQNGVDNAERIAAEVAAMVLPAVVYVATEMAAPGHVRHHGRGELVIGPRDAAAAADAGQAQVMQALAQEFAAAGVPVQIEPDVMAALWSKLLVNCVYNAISALARAPYGAFAAVPEIQALLPVLVREVVDVAAAAGVPMALDAALASTERIAQSMATQRSSTAQDMARRKRSEIDHLNGYVMRRGAELGVPTPVNQTLHALVKLVESRYDPA
jgi:2-dehydropantoate 2-reductase